MVRGEAIAIVDLDDDGTALPRVGPRGRRGRRRLGAALVGGLVGVVIVLWPSAPARPVPAVVPAASAPVAGTSAAAAAALFGATDKTLALPPGIIGVDLAAIPDRLLNDPPAARLRLPVLVRGTTGIAALEVPSEIAWTEAGYWYWLRSSDLSLSQLIDLASALR